MTTIRQELESRLSTSAAAQSPVLTVAYEAVPFTKPTAPFLECFLMSSGTMNPTVDGKRTRERGVFQVNVWVPLPYNNKHGMGTAEQIAAAIVAAFPVVPKTGNVSIEQTPSTGKAILDISGWVIVPTTISYRYEGTV